MAQTDFYPSFNIFQQQRICFIYKTKFATKFILKFWENCVNRNSVICFI